jgi:hypothetical protein
MMSETRFYVDTNGNYLGGWNDPDQVPAGAIQVANAPDHALDTWNGSGWVVYTPPTPPLPTKAELLAQIDAIQAQVNALPN